MSKLKAALLRSELRKGTHCLTVSFSSMKRNCLCTHTLWFLAIAIAPQRGWCEHPEFTCNSWEALCKPSPSTHQTFAIWKSSLPCWHPSLSPAAETDKLVLPWQFLSDLHGHQSWFPAVSLCPISEPQQRKTSVFLHSCKHSLRQANSPCGECETGCHI